MGVSIVLRLPPRIKVLEAASAIADNRIEVLDDRRAIVVSSDGSRRYRVVLDVARGAVYSDDNGTLLRGYVGYPIIAFMMMKKLLPYDEDVAKALRGIPWRRLNEELKRYAIVENVVKRIAIDRGLDPKRIDSFVDLVMSRLKAYRLHLDRNLVSLFS